MTTSTIEEQLVANLEDAYALEQHVAKAVLALQKTAADSPELKDPLGNYEQQTHDRLQRLEQRIRAHNATPSKVKDAGAIFAALAIGILGAARKDTAGKHARDGYVAVQLQIASYQLLERIASRAGDSDTAEVARTNRAEAQDMANTIDNSWDLALDLSLKLEGLQGAPPVSAPSSMQGHAEKEKRDRQFPQ